MRTKVFRQMLLWNYEFYVPYKSQASSADFLKFYKDDKTLFQKDITKEDLYR